MNYPYPIPGSSSVITTLQDGTSWPTYIADGTRRFPAFNKAPEERIGVVFDFSQLEPPLQVAGCWARVRPGGSPQLNVGPMQLNPPTGGADTVFALIAGGIAGRSYDVEINVKGVAGSVYSYYWVVNVTGDDCGCNTILTPPPTGGLVSADGSLIVNTAPRFFVSATIPVGANVLDRWYDTANGQLYDYISNGITTLWQQAGGGGGGGGSGSNVTILSITPIHPDGATTIFTLTTVIGRPVTVVGSNSLFVSIDGVWQDASSQYTAVNNQIQFAQAPSADSVVFMLWFAPYSSASPSIPGG